jgi:hypothetical protein
LGWMSFIASLVQSAVWPVAVVVVVILMRKPLGDALSHRLRRLKAGPVEAEFDREAIEVREEVRRIPEVAAAEPRQEPVSLSDELVPLTDVSPRAAVLEAFARIEERLNRLLETTGISYSKQSGPALARLAFDHNLISTETRSAIEGLFILRNLAAHSPRDDIGADRARDYVAMADAVLYAIRDKHE